MSDSLQEQIIKKIAEALAQIPNIKSVQRHQASGMDLGTMPTILVREGDCAAELTKSSHERIRRLCLPREHDAAEGAEARTLDGRLHLATRRALHGRQA